jgi:hypothetical protein
MSCSERISRSTDVTKCTRMLRARVVLRVVCVVRVVCVSRVCVLRFTFLLKNRKSEIVKSPKMGNWKVRKFATVLYVRYSIVYSLHSSGFDPSR